MLFNSFPFILVFLPAVLAGFFGFERAGRPTLARAFVTSTSVDFSKLAAPDTVFTRFGIKSARR